MGMMDSKYDSRWGVRPYLELNGMNANEFGIGPDMTFNNSNEKDEDFIFENSQNLPSCAPASPPPLPLVHSDL